MKPTSATLSDAGELAFISTIRALMPERTEVILRAAGEDCLVTAGPPGGANLLHTVDTFVDGVHFDPAYFGWDIIGRRIMTAAVSDIAAMGGVPVFSLAAMSMPGSAMFGDMVALFGGMQETASRYGCPIAGGETTSTRGPVTVSITVVGKVEPSRAVTRSGARPGDRIFVTGTIGDAMAGLMVFERGISGFEPLRQAFASPDAQVTAARALTAEYRLSAMIDISDGLSTDLHHICTESGVGADILADRVPLSEAYIAFAAAEGLDTISFAIRSGEEFQLLFTSDDERIPEQTAADGLPVACIGVITEYPPRVRMQEADGSYTTLTSGGYEHFTS